MAFPDYFERVPTLIVRDPLAGLLGAPADGLIEYRFADAVRLAGHACPTVAGAYLMALRMLRRLYGDDLPERGGLRVEFRGEQADGVVGVTAAVFGLLTGAAGEGGFKGLGGNYGRRGLLLFGRAGIGADVRLTRLDNGASLAASLDLSVLPPSPELGEAMQRVLAGRGGDEARIRFAALWQERVRSLLLDFFVHPALVRFAD